MTQWYKYETAMTIPSVVIYAIENDVSGYLRHLMFQWWKNEKLLFVTTLIRRQIGMLVDGTYLYTVVNAKIPLAWRQNVNDRYASRTAWTNQPNKVTPACYGETRSKGWTRAKSVIGTVTAFCGPIFGNVYIQYTLVGDWHSTPGLFENWENEDASSPYPTLLV